MFFVERMTVYVLLEFTYMGPIWEMYGNEIAHSETISAIFTAKT